MTTFTPNTIARWDRNLACDHAYEFSHETARGTLVYRCETCRGSKVEQGPNWRPIEITYRTGTGS